ncbi:M23 family metallopeptidase [Peribacillus frigoritolerans]|uniref:M23 family metallopeptidase n=1 Tax=Peribacillus frigoritolerans TaxID=450367 RepID=UPI002079E596|nr:M23 family metallopeptidase [Peribacillus frigoritolerans]USK77876.1 M23 family metallopeptidase [Peribacillus frigoritolerans]
MQELIIVVVKSRFLFTLLSQERSLRLVGKDPNNHKAGYGQRIVIKHSDGLESVYAHLSKFLVKNGQTVTQGQQIGNCGTTGSSTGMHLHFELVVNGQKKDAAPYLN